MIIINLTPHTIVFYIGDGKDRFKHRFSFKPSGNVARVKVSSTHFGHLNIHVGGLFERVQIPVFKNKNEEVEGLPPQEEDTIYLVSGIVLEALKGSGRFDVYAPDTGKTAVRDAKGVIIGVTQLLTIGD